MYQRNQYLMYAVSFLSGLHFFGAVMVPFFADWGGIGDFQIFMLQTWFIVWSGILEVPTGAVADRFGRKFSVCLGLFISGIGFTVYVSAPSIYVFLLGEFILALALALISGANMALLSDSLASNGLAESRTRIFGRVRAFSLLGMVAGTPLGSLIAARYGLPIPFYATTVSSGLALLVAFWLIEPPVVKKRKTYLEILSTGLKTVWQIPSVRWLTLDYVIVAAISFMMVWLYQFVLGDVGIPIVYFGFVHMASVSLESLVMHTLGTLEDRLGFRRLARLFVAASIVGFTLAAVGVVTQTPWLAIVGIITGIGIGLARQDLMVANIDQYLESSERATSLSTLRLIRNLAVAVLYLVVGAGIEVSLTWTLLGLSASLLVYLITTRHSSTFILDLPK